ncbi:uncharacterized protein LOC124934744 [Impatiens glandulifera]|uniref:uncharacterized protein LOC124934744 n=1 Tax=Impatiens glandulifera TaxID=253017 RepID=UPI001FB16AEF|nr:uncharacterized protein LOC124934744 [Impatiens glandulifera]
MSLLLWTVSPELIQTLGSKKTVKEAWDTLIIMRAEVELVQESKVQTRWTEFENLTFKDDKGVEAFNIRLAVIVNELEVLDDPMSEHKVVLKFFQEEWRSRKRQREQRKDTFNIGNKKGENSEQKNESYKYCGIPGHWANECRKAKRDWEQQEQSNLAKENSKEDESLMLLMTQICTTPTADNDIQEVFLNEEKVVPRDTTNNVWYLDTGASSHITGDKKMFTMLDKTVKGKVRFIDNYVVNICEKGMVMIECVIGDHHIIFDVFYIPSLNSNLLSLGQLDENGCKIVIENGVLCISDHSCKIIARV